MKKIILSESGVKYAQVKQINMSGFWCEKTTEDRLFHWKKHYYVDYGFSRFKSFIRHIHNYTEYNQQWNVSQVRSTDSAIIWNTNTREYI